MTKSGGLSKTVARSASWRIGRVAADNVLRFITFGVLARLLTPADFGLFAIAALAVTISNVIATAGMADVLVREKDPDEELKNTLFWANLGLAALLSAVLVAVSPLIADAYDDDRVVPLMAALSLTMMIKPFVFVNNAMAARAFQDKSLAIRNFIASVLSSAAAIAAAFAGWGLWALVVQTLVASVVVFLLTKWRFPWNPRFQFSWPRLKAVSSFSGNMLAAQLLQRIVVRMQELIASAFLSISAVGLYRVGSRFMELIGEAFISPVSSLGVPAFSRLRHDKARFAGGYFRMVATTSLIYSPMLLGFAAVADDAVPFCFGDQWTASIPVVQILSLLAPATVLAYFHGPALSAAGRSDVLRRITTLQAAGTVAFSLVGVQFGLIGLAAAFVLRAYLTLPVQMRWLRDATGVRSDLALAAAVKPFAAALAMAVGVYLLQPALREAIPHAAARLAVSCAVGTVAYAALMLALFRSFSLAHLKDLRSIVRPSSPGAA